MKKIRGYEEIALNGYFTEVVEKLQQYKKDDKKVYTTFYGANLYSDTVTYKNALKTLFKGYSPRTALEAIRLFRDGHKLLDSEYLVNWEREVFTWTSSSRKCTDLRNALTIASALNSGSDLDAVYTMLTNQHNFSNLAIVNIVEYICARGKEFSTYFSIYTRLSNKYAKKPTSYEIKALELEVDELVDKGKKVLDEKYMHYWHNYIVANLFSEYKDDSIVNSLEIAKALNDGCSFDEVGVILDKQNNSDKLRRTILNCVGNICNRGRDFDFILTINSI